MPFAIHSKFKAASLIQAFVVLLTLVVGLATQAWAQVPPPGTPGTPGGKPPEIKVFDYVAHLYVRGTGTQFPERIENTIDGYADQYNLPREMADTKCFKQKNPKNFRTDILCEGLFFFKDEFRVKELQNQFDGKIVAGQAKSQIAISGAETLLDLDFVMELKNNNRVGKRTALQGKFGSWQEAWDHVDQLIGKFSKGGDKRRGEFMDVLNDWDATFKPLLCQYWDAFKGFQVRFRLLDPRGEKGAQALLWKEIKILASTLATTEKDCPAP